jgi:hypothetical protein
MSIIVPCESGCIFNPVYLHETIFYDLNLELKKLITTALVYTINEG